MAEPFAVDASAGAPDLIPQGEAGQTAGIPTPIAPISDVGILPDTTPLVGPPPQLQLPPPPPPPPSPTQDPRQQLAALIALGMAVGQGVKGGGAGALQGFNETQQALRQDQLAQYQRAVNEQKVQEGVIKTQFTQDEIDYRQREAKLQQALANFKTQASKLTDKRQYDALADAYGNSLRAAGYRTIDPNWLRQNIPYVKPSQTALAQKAFTAWTSNPNNKRLLDENPAQAATSVVEVDLNGDGIKERMPLAKLAEAAGQSFAHDTNGGIIAVPKEANTGTSPFDVTLKGLVDEFKATNRRDPNPREKNTLIAKAVEMSRVKPPSDNTDKADARLDKSYQFNSTQLENLRKPIREQSAKLAQALEDVNQGTPQADALVAPAVLTALVGGQGSGLRMNEAEIQRIVGGRNNWQQLKSKVMAWQADPTKPFLITPEQRQQIRALLSATNDRLRQKLSLTDKAAQDLVDATDVTKHRQILADVNRQLTNVDNGAGAASGGQTIGRFQVTVNP